MSACPKCGTSTVESVKHVCSPERQRAYSLTRIADALERIVTLIEAEVEAEKAA